MAKAMCYTRLQIYAISYSMPQHLQQLGRKSMSIDKWQQHLLQSDPYPTQMNLFASQIKFTPENI